MKFTVKKADISEAVTNIQRAVSSKTSIPALEGILIQAFQNGIELSAYDLELGIKTVIPASTAEEGKSILNARIFSDIVRKTPDENITVTVDEKNMAYIESGQSSFSIIGMPAEEFPELPKLSDATVMRLPMKLLKGMIRQTLFAVAESDAKPIHQGSLFNIENGILDIVSVDGYRLAKRSEAVNLNESMSFVVPGKALVEIVKLLNDTDDDVEISAGKRHILFKIASYTVISSLLEGEFLNYKAAIPKDSSIEVEVNTREFIDSVERVSLLITDRIKSPLRCTFTENSINLLCITSMGRASDVIPAKVAGGELEMGFNNRYLLDALKNTECDEIKIKLNGVLGPMVVLPKENENFLFLVLPVRLKSE